jgi:DNA repair exonuclease SbcCD nuclease subunit
MRVFITTDWHFGIYVNSIDKWLNMMEDYFYNFFIPYIKANAKEGDILIHCGDLYDNRTSIPIIASYKAEKILLELSKILPVHVIVGNHDLWNKGSNDVNSIRLFNYVDNISVYTETSVLEIGGRKLVLMPWIEKKSEQIEEIKSYTGDYLFCHSDLNGCLMHLNSVAHRNIDKIDVDEFARYKHVFSGHIHIRQTKKNFTFIGSPYEMDRNDMNNDKGITILDLETDRISFHKNTYSPRFKKLELLTEADIDKLDNLDTKDYIDLFISNSLLVGNRKLRRKLEIVLEQGNFASVDYIDDINKELKDGEKISDIVDENGEIKIRIDLDFEDYIREYINSQKWESDKIKLGIMSEYEDILNSYKLNHKSNNDQLQ